MLRIPTSGPPTHPGEMLLEEFLKPLRMSQAELAGKIGVSYPRINELVRGKCGVTPDTALRLEKLLGMEAQSWLNLQLAWDLYIGRSASSWPFPPGLLLLLEEPLVADLRDLFH